MLLNFIILIYNITNIFSYIILPLNVPKENFESSIKPIEIIKNISKSEIYTSLEVGSEKIKIKLILSHKINGLIIAGKKIKHHKYDETL